MLAMGTLYQMEVMLRKLYPSANRFLLSALSLLGAWLFAACPPIGRPLPDFSLMGCLWTFPCPSSLPLMEFLSGKRQGKTGIRHAAFFLLLAGAAVSMTGCQADAPVGTYVEQVIRSGERQKKNIPWLSDYLKAMREGSGVEAYVLESVPEGFLVKRHTYLFER